jgi:oligopeptidase B
LRILTTGRAHPQIWLLRLRRLKSQRLEFAPSGGEDCPQLRFPCRKGIATMRRFLFFAVAPLFSMTALATFVSSQDAPQPPVAKQEPHLSNWHGEEVNDPYFWLREKSNPEVIEYLNAENAYTEAMTREMQPFADLLYKELLSHIKQTDADAPTRYRGYYYYARREEGKQYSIRCRKKAGADGVYVESAPEEILLDVNKLAEGKPFMSIGDFQISDDGKRLAYTVDATGFRQYELFVKELETEEVIEGVAQRVTSLEWASDNETLFYVTEDAITKRSNLVWRHNLNDEAEPVFFEEDRLFNVAISRGKDRKHFFVFCASTDTYETRYLPCDATEDEFKVVLSREKGHKYSVDHRDGVFYILTNKAAKNFRLVAAPMADPSEKNWKELIAHRPEVLLEGVDLFRDYLVTSEKAEALTHLKVHDFKSGKWTEVDFPEALYDAAAGGTPEFDSEEFRFQYESMVTQPSVFDFNMRTGQRTLRKQTEVPLYDPTLYATERAWAKARDGAKIPLSIVYKKGTPKDGSAPLFLYAYGSYGYGMSPSFDSDRQALLDRGMIYVIAHIRGGNELGEPWHDDGMLMKKMNTFTDFIDSAEYLIANQWTKSDRLVIEGGSAGGLLMGAVTNLRPDLFKAVHSAVPFVDVMNTMMDASLPLTVGEYLEWGNPNDKAAFDYMRSYSPYDNLAKKNYPAILVTTSLNDSQVMYWEPTKYVAKLRTLKTDKNPLLLKCLMGAGHGGASGRYDALKETAFEYAWLLNQVGITK